MPSPDPPTDQAVEIYREDLRTLVLRAPGGFFNAFQGGGLLKPPEAGFRRELSDVTYEVLGVTDDGRFDAVRVRFARPLEDPKYLWLVGGGGGGLEDFVPPVPGHSVHTEGGSAADLLRVEPESFEPAGDRAR